MARRSASRWASQASGGRSALGAVRRRDPRRDLVRAQVAQAAQQVVDLVGGRGRPLRREGLQLQLQVGQGARVEQLAQLVRPEQLAQEVAVERQRLRAAVGERRVAFVHVGRDVVEEERAGERRGARQLDADEADLAPLERPQQGLQRRQVEDVLEALAVRLQDDREAAVPAGHGQELRGPLPHLPQRRARAGSASRQQQRPGRVLAEAAGEERRPAEDADDQLLHLVRGDAHGGLGRGRPALAVEVQRARPTAPSALDPLAPRSRRSPAGG